MRVRWSWSTVIWAIAASVYGQQAPIRILEDESTSGSGKRITGGTSAWDLDLRPAQNSTSHLLFDTVNSLLQHWPNTRYRNGHNLVPATVPPGTLLYHGTYKPDIPKIPEWTATDPEHSYYFCRGRVDSGCWHLTLVTTRSLKLLYFDGSSAAKIQGGSMDSQDIILWGKIMPEWTFEERKRINELCEWGKTFGLDGFVRMEIDFEIMLCDFSVGVETVSFLNLASQHYIRSNTSTAYDAGWSQLIGPKATPIIESGSWHNHFPGDSRIQLDLTRLVSFYDTSLAPSLIPLRQQRDRYQHRLEGIDQADRRAVLKRLNEVLRDDVASNSGIDWKSLARIIVLRYADRLELVQYFLNETNQEPPRLDRIKTVQAHLRVMLTPYILHSAAPPEVGSDITALSWATPVFKHCATTHTIHITSKPEILAKLTKSERLILNAVQDTTKEICRVVVKLWAEGVQNGLDPILGQVAPTMLSKEKVDSLLRKWKEEIAGLMEWLDWSVWVKCKPACRLEEICYLPTWPFIGSRPPRLPKPERPVEKTTTEEDQSWLKPKPSCLRRVHPFDL